MDSCSPDSCSPRKRKSGQLLTKETKKQTVAHPVLMLFDVQKVNSRHCGNGLLKKYQLHRKSVWRHGNQRCYYNCH